MAFLPMLLLAGLVASARPFDGRVSGWAHHRAFAACRSWRARGSGTLMELDAATDASAVGVLGRSVLRNQPVLLRRAFTNTTAVRLWGSDDYLLQKPTAGLLVDVEPADSTSVLEKGEPKTIHTGVPLDHFLGLYNRPLPDGSRRGWYAVAELDHRDPAAAALLQDVELPPMLGMRGLAHNAAHYRAVFWMSDGGTRSFIHTDTTEDNLIIMLRGSKVVRLRPLDRAAMADLAFDPHFALCRWGGGTWNAGVRHWPSDDENMTLVTLHAGDALLIPAWWAHSLEGADNSMMLSLFFRGRWGGSGHAKDGEDIDTLLNHMARFCERRRDVADDLCAATRATGSADDPAAHGDGEEARCDGGRLCTLADLLSRESATTLWMTHPYNGQVLHLPHRAVEEVAIMQVGLMGTAARQADATTVLCINIARGAVAATGCLEHGAHNLSSWSLPDGSLSGSLDLGSLGLFQLAREAGGSGWVSVTMMLDDLASQTVHLWVDTARHVVRASRLCSSHGAGTQVEVTMSALSGEDSAESLASRYAPLLMSGTALSDAFRTEAGALLSSADPFRAGAFRELAPGSASQHLLSIVTRAVTGYLVSGADADERAFTFSDADNVHFTNIDAGALRSLADCIASVLLANVPGSIVEAGVWRGGAGIVMKAALVSIAASEGHVQQRAASSRLLLVDSFGGIPANCTSRNADKNMEAGQPQVADARYATNLTTARATLRRFGMDHNVELVQHTFPCYSRASVPPPLPTALVRALAVGGGGIAMLHLDVTVPAAYKAALEALYPLVSPGGFVVVDDWMRVDVQAAILSFRREHGVCTGSPITIVDTTGATNAQQTDWWGSDTDPVQRTNVACGVLSGGGVAVWQKPLIGE